MGAMKAVKQWYHGRYVRTDPSEPDEIGGMGVLHEMELRRHWSAEAVHQALGFAAREWRWLIGLGAGLVGALAKALLG